jgi:hypothetical protein
MGKLLHDLRSAYGHAGRLARAPSKTTATIILMILTMAPTITPCGLCRLWQGKRPTENLSVAPDEPRSSGESADRIRACPNHGGATWPPKQVYKTAALPLC